jgi:hypothetical protein
MLIPILNVNYLKVVSEKEYLSEAMSVKRGSSPAK